MVAAMGTFQRPRVAAWMRWIGGRRKTPRIFFLFKSVTAEKLPYLYWGRRSRPGDRLQVLGQLFGLAVERRVAAFHGDHLARHRLHHGALAGNAHGVVVRAFDVPARH